MKTYTKGLLCNCKATNYFLKELKNCNMMEFKLMIKYIKHFEKIYFHSKTLCGPLNQEL